MIIAENVSLGSKLKFCILRAYRMKDQSGVEFVTDAIHMVVKLEGSL